jgi:DNA-directed RNA polymerase sigma subunit (sigma70/sigma32)
MSTLTYADQRLIWKKRRERAVAMHDNGLTLADIAEQLQCTRQRVHQMLTKMRKEEKRT